MNFMRQLRRAHGCVHHTLCGFFTLPMEICTRCAILHRAVQLPLLVMAGWKAIGWIYSWIKQIKFTVHRRVLSAAGCYPPATALLNGTTGSSEFARLAEAGRLLPIQLARYAWLKAER